MFEIQEKTHHVTTGENVREERAQITPGCFRFHVSRSRRKPVRVLRRGVKIHRKGIFLDKHIWNQIACHSVHGGLAVGGVGGMQPCLLGSSVVSLGAPWGWRRSVAGQAPSLDDTGASLAVEQLLCGLCPKHSPRWEPLLVYPCPWSVQGLGSMCTRVPAVLGVHMGACSLGVHTGACNLECAHGCTSLLWAPQSGPGGLLSLEEVGT